MKRLYYIFSNGRLARRQNTLYLHQYNGEREDTDELSLADAAEQSGCVLEECEELNGLASETMIGEQGSGEFETSGEPQRVVLQKKPIPVEDVEAIYLFGEADLNTKLLNFAARHRVPIHVFNYYGFYSGTFSGRAEVNSGYLLVRQVEHYSHKHKRLQLARAFVDGASFNILKNLRYYASRGREVAGIIEQIEEHRMSIDVAMDIPTLMGTEGSIRALYYSAWSEIFSASWAEFTRRVKRPPDNPVNALVSFGNSLCYTLALSEIYRTALSPLISFLHEPGDRRYSLSLDIAEIFKPILCDRLIFKLINNGELQPKHFEEALNFCYLKETGRKVFVPQWDERLKTTIEHRKLGRSISYRRLVRLECYKIQKHLLGIQTYEPFKIWW
jgi:CRISPR-associated protein Cas1